MAKTACEEAAEALAHIPNWRTTGDEYVDLCEDQETMPTMQEIDHNETWLKNTWPHVYGALVSIFDAARRGVEADHELQNAFEDAVTRAEKAEAALAEAVRREREEIAAMCMKMMSDASEISRPNGYMLIKAIRARKGEHDEH